MFIIDTSPEECYNNLTIRYRPNTQRYFNDYNYNIDHLRNIDIAYNNINLTNISNYKINIKYMNQKDVIKNVIDVIRPSLGTRIKLYYYLNKLRKLNYCTKSI